MANALANVDWVTIIVEAIIGVVITACILSPIKKSGKKLEKFIKDLAQMRLGVQWMLRRDLNEMYKDATRNNYASLDRKKEFEDGFQIYESLGENGVMNETRKKFLALPDSKSKNGNNKHK